jgi:RNA polymerase sigma-70 factor, ECF subfamily
MEDENDIDYLIGLVLSGNKQAFGELYDRTIQEVYKTIHFLLDEKADVDDVVQETYIQVFKNLSKFDRKRNFKPWITGIAIKQIHAYRRKRWMLLRVINKVGLYEKSEVIDITNEMIEKIANEKIAELVNHLPFKLKQVVILHYLNEHSQEDVAAILNIPIGTVKSRIHASLKKLRQVGTDQHIFFKGVKNA